MGRYTHAVCRLCRREGMKLYLKGSRCYTKKCAFERRPTPPGQHGVRRRKLGDYGQQLREKQKVRYIYGIMEEQLQKYMEEAFAHPGVTGAYLMQQLERRLDNVVYRLGFAESRNQARQLVRHGHITVNGKKVSVPSYQVKVGDLIGWKESTKNEDFFKELVQEGIGRRPVPAWLALDTEKMEGRVVRLPEEEDVDTDVESRLIVEYYSR